jgi:hypothetical protein
MTKAGTTHSSKEVSSTPNRQTYDCWFVRTVGTVPPMESSFSLAILELFVVLSELSDHLVLQIDLNSL